MTAVHHPRIRVLGANARVQLLAAVGAHVAAWSADWVVGAPFSAWFAGELSERRRATRCFGRDDSEGVVHGAWTPERPLAIMMGRDDAAQQDPRFASIADEALLDLAGRLLGIRPTASLGAEAMDSRGAVRFEVGRMGDAMIELTLDSRLRDRYAPPVAQARGALSARGEAALQVSAEATASLPIGSFALDRVAALVPGDVLVTDRRLDDGLDLRVAGMPVGVRVAVGRRGERRAVLALSSEQS